MLPRLRVAGRFDLTVAAGTCVAITGPSGSGKSRLLRLVADLDPQDCGVFLDGVGCAAMPAPEWRRRVAYVAAESAWWAEDVAAHFPDLAPAGRLAAEFGLRPDLMAAPVRHLSSGERQRLALIRALLNRPAVLLLDEPTAALDAATTLRAETVLRRCLAAGTAILLVTHNLDQAARMATRHLVMRDGRLSE